MKPQKRGFQTRFTTRGGCAQRVPRGILGHVRPFSTLSHQHYCYCAAQAAQQHILLFDFSKKNQKAPLFPIYTAYSGRSDPPVPAL